MRSTLLMVLALGALAAADFAEDPWVEEEELEEPYNEEEYARERSKRAVDEELEVADCEAPRRSHRAARQVHQYEVHEPGAEAAHAAPPYDQMLAASVEHYHRVRAAPAGAARLLRDDVSRGSDALGVHVPADPLAHRQGPAGVASLAPDAVPAPVSVSAAILPAPLPLLRQHEDQFPAAGQHHHTHARGGGNAHKGQYSGDHGAKSIKGFKTDQYLDKGAKGFKKDENHRKEYEEAAGKKTKHHDHAGHKGDHEEEAHGHRGSNFAEKKGHKKGHKTKGYHNKYHKDEFHKEHKFYDDFHKGGEHHRYGKFNAKHASNESGKKKAHHLDAGHEFVEHGKKGYSNKGHVDADHQGHKGRAGHEEHHENHSQYGKKGGRGGGAQWGHGNKN